MTPDDFLIAEADDSQGNISIIVEHGAQFFGVEGGESTEEEGEDHVISDDHWQLEGKPAHYLVVL